MTTPDPRTPTFDGVVTALVKQETCARCGHTTPDCSAAIRTLLSDGPSSVGEVEMAGTRVTPVGDDNHWRDREYPGDDNHWRVTGGGENEGVDTGN